jgi:hypothetical protein
MTTKESHATLVEILRAWQRSEDRRVSQSSEIVRRARHPVVRMVMEVLRRDSAMHHRVQQFIIDSIESDAVSPTVEDLESVWSAIDAHVAAERETAKLVAAAQEKLAGTQNVVQHYLLSYLAADEKKHDELLDGLNLIKRGMYRSA